MKHKKGFTLIELLVVVAIMGLLASLAVVALNNARARARDARRLSDIKQIQTALELYYLDKNEYPDPVSDTDHLIEGLCIGGDIGIGTCSATETIYMRIIPSNPEPLNDGGAAACGTNPSVYTYEVSTSGDNNYSYHIRYCIGAKTGGIPLGHHYATPAGLVDE